MEEILYTVKETAKLLKVNPNYVYDLIKKEMLPALKLGSFKIRRTSLLNFVKAHDAHLCQRPHAHHPAQRPSAPSVEDPSRPPYAARQHAACVPAYTGGWP